MTVVSKKNSTRKNSTCRYVNVNIDESSSPSGAAQTGSTASSVPPVWQRVDCTSDVAPTPLPFSEPVGSTLQLPLDSKPVDFFRHLLDDRILDELVKETNQYVVEIDKAFAHMHN